MGRDANGGGTRRMRSIEVLDRANPREQQYGHLGARDAVGRRLNPLTIGVRAESVIEARARQSVAVADFNRVHACAIERRGNPPHIAHGILMANRVHAVAQSDVLDVQTVHTITCRAAYDSASRSPVRSAADVMMSRLPAYFGR